MNRSTRSKGDGVKRWFPNAIDFATGHSSPPSQLRVLLLVLFLYLGKTYAADPAQAVFKSIPNAQFQFSGVIGDRISANVDNWLLRAPSANPGMIEMFRLRDRAPEPKLVPWAGEFVGK